MRAGGHKFTGPKEGIECQCESSPEHAFVVKGDVVRVMKLDL